MTATRALAKADVVDAARARGTGLGPLAGAPFAVKNLFDIQGLPTRAGSKINRDRAPATQDATLLARLEAAGAILVGALNMGEYAYDFTGENAHDGPSRNPHDPTRMTGGSSGGSGAAVAGGLVPIALGSDTNGSIRVPRSFCGLFGLKPTYGRLSRAGAFPFVASFDHLGPLARSVDDLALAFDAMQGRDPTTRRRRDMRCADRVADAQRRNRGLRIADRRRLFRAAAADASAFAAVDAVARALGGAGPSSSPEAAGARAAAYVITMVEGARFISSGFARGRSDFDPDIRDRLIAGAMLPGAGTSQAQRFRRSFRDHALKLFHDVDVVLAPATPCRAPEIGQKTMILDGKEMPVRPNLGVFTQPISFIGLPVVVVPVWTGARACRSGCRSSLRPGARILH